MSKIAKDLIESVKSLGVSGPIPLHEPKFHQKEKDYVSDCVESGWVSSVGKYVDQFENDLSSITGIKKAVACVNGTAAIQVGAHLLGVTANTEVFLPSMTFVGTANAVSHCGATPHFVDTDPETLAIDVAKLEKHIETHLQWDGHSLKNPETHRPISALICMHLWGHIPDLTDLQNLCTKYNLPILEDAAQALGSQRQGHSPGHWGCIATLSFNGNKIITTGGGGAILSNDTELAAKAKHLTTTARTQTPHHFAHDELAYNFRLPNINAALGCGQLLKLPEYLEKKRRLAHHYLEVFTGNASLEFVVEPAETKSNYWLNAVRIKDAAQKPEIKFQCLEDLAAAKIFARPLWDPLHTLSFYKEAPKMSDLSGANELFNTIITLPSSPHLADGLSQ